MIWNVLQAITAFYTLVRGIKQYKRLEQIYKRLKSLPLTDISELAQTMKDKKPLQKLFVIIKGICLFYVRQQLGIGIGIARATSSDKNILSILSIQDLKQEPLILNQLKSRNWASILSSPFKIRPQSLKQLTFNLNDLNLPNSIQISSCEQTNLSGSLSQVYKDRVIFKQISNRFLRVIRMLFNFIAGVYPFNLFLTKWKYGQQITYYGIMDGQFLLAIGEVYKDFKGKLVMDSPLFLTKQKAFILKRLKKKIHYFYWIILIISLIKIYVLYQLGKKAITYYINKRQSNINLKDQIRSQDEKDFVNCVICYTNIRSIVLKPCRHYGFCYQCYTQFKQKGCPLCKTQISGIIKITKRK